MKRNLIVTGLSLFALAVSLGSARAATTDLSISPRSGTASYQDSSVARLSTYWVFTVTFTDPASIWDYTLFSYISSAAYGGSGGRYEPGSTPHGGSSPQLRFDLEPGSYACSSDNYIKDPNGQVLHYANGPITVSVDRPSYY